MKQNDQCTFDTRGIVFSYLPTVAYLEALKVPGPFSKSCTKTHTSNLKILNLFFHAKLPIYIQSVFENQQMIEGLSQLSCSLLKRMLINLYFVLLTE